MTYIIADRLCYTAAVFTSHYCLDLWPVLDPLIPVVRALLYSKCVKIKIKSLAYVAKSLLLVLSGVKWQENGAFVSESGKGLPIGHAQRKHQIGNVCPATMHFYVSLEV